MENKIVVVEETSILGTIVGTVFTLLILVTLGVLCGFVLLMLDMNVAEKTVFDVAKNVNGPIAAYTDAFYDYLVALKDMIVEMM